MKAALQRVGVFDSGVGGLSVWREIERLMPELETIYVADQTHIPYGPRPADEIRGFARGITTSLLQLGCSAIVVACNAASAASLAGLRAEFPGTPFVGMEPAVKPAAELSRSRVAGVLSTPATLQGALFASVLERFAEGVRIVQQVCPGLVERVEMGDVEGPETESMLRGFLQPSLEAGADTLVLACTHYPFVQPLIEQLAGPGVRVIDPAPAVARQLQRVLPSGARSGEPEPPRHFYTTGDRATFDRIASTLLQRPMHAKPARWLGSSLELGA